MQRQSYALYTEQGYPAVLASYWLNFWSSNHFRLPTSGVREGRRKSGFRQCPIPPPVPLRPDPTLGAVAAGGLLLGVASLDLVGSLHG